MAQNNGYPGSIFYDFFDEYGFYIKIIPEYYETGINWNWQIEWYLPNDKKTKNNFLGGTGLYGDNGEFPMRFKAELYAFEEAFQLLEVKISV